MHLWNRKVAQLPDEGVLLVATDLQGNFRDYERMLELHEAALARGPAVLAFCGDLVHGPSPDLHEPGAWPPHLGTPYVDESARLIRHFANHVVDAPVFSLMGNHEHSHVGGPVCPKFYDDEAKVLDEALGPDAPVIHDLLRQMPLLATSRAGIVLTHGAPRRTEPSIQAFEDLTWEGYRDLSLRRVFDVDTLGALLWSRGCTDADALALLEVTTGRREGVVVHGHDVVRHGFAREGRHHVVVSTSFGLHDDDKVYVRVDLSERYHSTDDLREGIELLKLY